MAIETKTSSNSKELKEANVMAASFFESNTESY